MNKCKYAKCTTKYKTNYRRGYCPKHYQEYLLSNSFITDKERKAARPAIIEGNIAKIPLGVNAKQGYAIVDREYAYLADLHKFYLTHTTLYAFNSTDFLHHLIIGKPEKGFVTDHINRNRLDNRRENLRHVPFAMNIQNAKGQPNLSGYKGVAKSGKRWRAYIKPLGKQLHLGSFATKEEAAKAYDKSAGEYWGKYAYLNFPE